MAQYPLETILATFSKYKKSTQSVQKRMLFNLAPLGGISSNMITLFFFALPFIEFALIFNPVVFHKLGIAQSIIFFIVFLSIVMIIIFSIAWMVNKSVIKKITPSWKEYFSDIDLHYVLSSGITPYSDFYNHYAKVYDLKGEELHKALKEAFLQMQEENSELLEAMNRDKQRG